MELTFDQARQIARLRRRHRGADLVVHERQEDVIVEVQRDGRAVALQRFAADGSVGGEQPARRAA